MSANRRPIPPDFDEDETPDVSSPYWQDRFAKAPVVRGRPRSQTPRVSTTIRLDAEVLDRFKAEGPGWQSRINEALRKAIGLP